MPTDFAPHDLTNYLSHSPFNLTGSRFFAAGREPWKVLDGVLSGTGGYWLGIDNGVGSIVLDLDCVTEYTEFTPHDLTSKTSHSPIVVSESSEFTAGGNYSWKTLDGGTGLWIGTGMAGGGDWLKYDFGAGNSYVLGAYDIVIATTLARAPKNWTIQGSDDNSNWTTIGTVANQQLWTSGERRKFLCDTLSTAYRYFQLVITANNGDANYTEIRELYLYSYAVGSPTTKILGSYEIRASATSARAPKTWTVEGSPNGLSWTTLDTVASETSWSANETRSFVCDVAATAYRLFRLNITVSNDATYTEIQELYLYEADAPSGKRIAMFLR